MSVCGAGYNNNIGASGARMYEKSPAYKCMQYMSYYIIEATFIR